MLLLSLRLLLPLLLVVHLLALTRQRLVRRAEVVYFGRLTNSV